MEAPPVQFVTTSDGFSIACCVQGRGDPWVIVPPGFHHLRLALEEDEMSSWVAGLSENFRLIRYDSRGQGLSSRSVGHVESLNDYVLDLEAVLKKLHPGPVILLGIGSSAKVAVLFAAKNPERVRALVLVHCGLTSEPWPRALLDLVAKEDWETFLRTMTSGQRSASEAHASMGRLAQMVEQDDFLRRFHAHEASDVTEVCRQLQVPALVLHLRRVDRPSLQQSAEVAATIPNCRLDEIEGGTPPWFWGNFDSALPIVQDFLRSIAPAEEVRAAIAREGLSRREVEVLQLLAAGRTNQEIADELVISLNTVRSHVSNIFDKTGVTNRAQAAIYARDHSLTD